MPRRGFFRSSGTTGGGGEKKSSRKKQQKLQKQIAARQQQQYQKQHQQQQHTRTLSISGSQASSSTNANQNEIEPPLGLDGPSTINQNSQSSTSEPSAAAPKYDQNTTEKLNELLYYQQQLEYQKQLLLNQVVSSSTSPIPNQHPAQYIEVQNHQQQNEQHSQQYPQQYPPQQLFEQQHQQQQQQQYPQGTTTSLTVDNAIDEIWRCPTDNFRLAIRSIERLRLAIVAEWESNQIEENNTFSYDPSDTFLSLQGATLRFHARFQQMKTERDAIRKHGGLDTNGAGESSVAADTMHSGTTNSQSLNGVEWELQEQAAYEVWEESLRASAALTSCCVGSAWRKQLKVRRQLIDETDTRLLHQQVNFSDNMSVGSNSIGGESSIMSASFVSTQLTAGSESILTNPVWQPPTDILQMLGFIIPEVLPACMIRFASSSIENSIPPLRSRNTKIYWDDSTTDNWQSLVITMVQDEQRWLRRRKRLGDTQRDLAFGLFCEGKAAEVDKKSDKKWSMPGGSVPTAIMIHSWLSTSCTWPIPKFEGRVEETLPCHMEEISNEVQLDPRSSEASEEDVEPPTEIVFQVKVDSSGSIPPPSAVVSEPIVEPTYRKFSFWNDLVDNQIDWWYTLRVLRDITDLVAAGWRPPKSGDIGVGIIEILISISEGGLVHLDNSGLLEDQIRKERLVACSCSSESLVTMKTLASRDALPQESLRPLALSLCQLISAAESPSSVSSSSGSEGIQAHQDAMFENEILTQRTFVAANSAELLWVLLSNENTACPTVDALLDAIDIINVEITDDNRVEVETGIAIACGAMRALSAAMFGDPPAVRGVPLLRFFWEPVIDIYGRVASSYFKSSTKMFNIAGHDTYVIDVDELPASTDSDPFLNLVLEIVLSFQRLVDSEMDLNCTEWESFVKAIDIGIAPWLIPREDETFSPVAQEIRNESMVIISQLTNFLEVCSSSSSGVVHPIIDDDARKYLHLWCLRKVAPLLIGEDASVLAFAVIKSWCATRSLPLKEGDWSANTGELLKEAFAIPESQSDDCRYINSYLHHPLVRLEALKSLFDDDSEISDSLRGDRDSDSVSSATSSISAITPVSLKSGFCPPVFSLFTLTKNLRELHLMLVNRVILPRLEEILSCTKPSSAVETTECQPSQNNTSISTTDVYDTIEQEFVLRRYAVSMLGMLYRSQSGDTEKRQHFIKMLYTIAISTPYGIREWVDKRERDVESSPTAGFISPLHLLKGELMSLRFESIRQLEACLGACFTSLPHTHGNVPQILNALCDIARFYSTEKVEIDQGLTKTDCRLLILASILPLARLGSSRTGHVIRAPKQEVTQNIPDDVLSVVSINDCYNINLTTNDSLPIVLEERDLDSDNGDTIASFLFVKQHTSGNEASQSSQSSKHDKRRRSSRRHDNHLLDGKQGTSIDFEPITSITKSVLLTCLTDCSSPSQDEQGHDTISHVSIKQLVSILCTICYKLLSSHWQVGLSPPRIDDLLWLDAISSKATDKHDNEEEAQSQMVADYSGVLGHTILGHKDNNIQLAAKVCDVLVQMSKLSNRCVQTSCCGLISLLSSLRFSFESKSLKKDKGYSAISQSLIIFIEHVCSVLKEDDSSSSDSVLIPLIDTMREAALCFKTFVACPVSLRRRAFLILYTPTRGQWEIQVVALQCVIAIINSMSTEEVAFTMSCIIPPKEENVKTLPNQQRIQPLIMDLLRKRLISDRLLKLSNSHYSDIDCYKSSRVHERLARAYIATESFPVDKDGLGNPQVAAWKAGQAILILRLGSKDSVYRGYVEVVLCTPCARIKRLVKWRKECIIDNPTSFLPFYSQIKAKPKYDDTEIEENITHRSEENEGMDVSKSAQIEESEESISIMEKAREIIERFDSLVGDEMEQDDDDNNEEAKPPEVSTTLLQRRSLTTATNRSRKFRRTVSDGDLSSIPTAAQPRTTHVTNSVYSWLQSATCQEDIDEDLILELEAFGFSRSALGVPDDMTSIKAYPDLFIHQKLKPYKISPNFTRAMSLLERVVPFQTHRIALFYGGPYSTKKKSSRSKSSGSSNTNSDADKFLSVTQASPDFWQFAKSCGDLVHVKHLKYFSGGLDTEGGDGEYTFVSLGCHGGSFELNDPILVDSMCVFHTVALMPDRLTNRKRHVGNDVVHIVYGLETDTLDIDHDRLAISTQFGFITIYVIPLAHVPLFKVSVHLRAGLDTNVCSALDHLVGSWLISRKVGGHFVVNLAKQADVICQSMIEDKLGLVLNTEERAGRLQDTERHLMENAGDNGKERLA